MSVRSVMRWRSNEPIVFGASFGGMGAQAYATRHVGHPGKLILSSTRSRHNHASSIAVFERLAGADVAEIARAYFDKPTPESGKAFRQRCRPYYYRRSQPDPDAETRQVRSNPRLLLHYRQHETSMDFLADLARVTCPTLIMGGEDHPICPIGDMEDTAAALPSHLVRFERFPGCGHSSDTKTQNERFG